MKKFRDIFIVLVYRNIDDLVDFLKSIKNSVADYHIIVVNSYYDQDSMLQIKKVAENYDCDFVNTENKGYGHGNNVGLQFARDNYDFDRVVISNPDIIIKEYHQDELDKLDSAAIGGIVENINGSFQNPLAYFNNKFSSWLIYNGLKYNHRTLFSIGLAINKITRIFCMIGFKKDFLKVFAVHGCFFVLTLKVVESIDQLFDENIFMFGEEVDLGYKLQELGIPVYFTKWISVFHKEDGSQKFSKLNSSSEMKKSNIYVYEKHRK
ncbi:glycosyltransferase family 2 protein [Sphaerochaeta globosa]|uniref:Glycosyl transferase family 2 n=1 Tax=Sphaerochaeta globosa (strain ATCC BAA-1886 / DSM 22777 / Buddy) TaxID=158189 RepID=F0RXT0_SPHGB|nr:glycosyltransferase family 2 protein [Sphaerochaeta globosa]ADY12207.1 hypothetical protein SpiBuddy_0371 [Sphaerochaeta globosa str. Buddy]